MRRYRPIHYWPAIVMVALGITAVPSTVGADDDPGDSPDETTAATAAAPEGAVPPPAPEPEPDEQPEPQPEPPVETTAPEPPSTTPDTVPPTTVPPTTVPPTTVPPTTVPPTTVPPSTVPPSTEPPSTGPPSTSPADEPDVPPVDEPEAPEAEDPIGVDDELDAEPDQLIDDATVRTIAFPVLGPVQYSNGWGACRDGCARRHVGTDIIGVRMQPLLAAVDGTVTRLRYENVGTAGVVISITGADGWYYNYFHANNDTPGTDDGAAGPEWQIAPGLTEGSQVRAGQVIGYMGDSGNAEGSVPHLHFEIRRPDRTPVNPYHSLQTAQRTLAGAGQPGSGLLPGPAPLSPDAVAVIAIDGGGRWLIDRNGQLFGEGSAAEVAGIAVPVDAVPALAPPASPVELPAALASPPPATPPPAAPAAPAGTPWTVEPGQSLWQIVQSAYGVSDVSSTASLVRFAFDHNRDQLSDPDALEVGTTLLLPPILL